MIGATAMMELAIKSDGDRVNLTVLNFTPKIVSICLNRIFDDLAKDWGKDPVVLKAAYLVALAAEFGISIEVDNDETD